MAVLLDETEGFVAVTEGVSVERVRVGNWLCKAVNDCKQHTTMSLQQKIKFTALTVLTDLTGLTRRRSSTATCIAEGTKS